jgi:hypothetical protein
MIIDVSHDGQPVKITVSGGDAPPVKFTVSKPNKINALYYPNITVESSPSTGIDTLFENLQTLP